MNEILEEQGIKEKNKEPVIREIDKLNKLSEKQIKQKLKKYKASSILALFKKPESYFKKYKSYQEIEQLKKSCKLYGLDVKFSPSLARGLSYYTGTVFEGKVKNSKDSFVGGGVFLINGIRCIGYGMGLERLSQLAKIKLDNEQTLIISIQQDNQAIKLSEKLRKNNIPSILLTNKSISKSLNYANSKNIPYVIFLGKDEVKKNKLKLRDMKSGKEKLISENQAINKLKKLEK
jgi:histidyl-tRNA synthetase